MFVTSRHDSDFRHPSRPAVLGFSIGTIYQALRLHLGREGSYPAVICLIHDKGF